MYSDDQQFPSNGQPPAGPPQPGYLPAAPFPQYGVPPVAPARPRQNKALLIILGIVIGGVAVLCCGGGVALFALRQAGNSASGQGSQVLPFSVPRSSAEPWTPSASLPLDSDRVYEGSGSKVVRLSATADLLHTITMTHNGSGGFAVVSLDESGKIVDLLGNSYGKYNGTMLVDGREQPTALQIRATGSWKMVIRDARRVATWTGKGSGKISTVLQVDPATIQALTTVRYSHAGKSNFVIHSFDGQSFDLLANEIGRVQGETTLPAGTRYIEIEADGAWTFNRQS